MRVRNAFLHPRPPTEKQTADYAATKLQVLQTPQLKADFTGQWILRDLKPVAPPPRFTFGGHWTGTWKNSVGETGKDNLSLKDDGAGNLTGTWWGIAITGKSRGADGIDIEGRTAKRFYQATGRYNEGELVISYTGLRLDAAGQYAGESRLRRAPR